MIHLFYILSIIVISVLVVTLLIIQNKKGDMKNSIQILLCMSCFGVATNMLINFCTSYFAASLCYSLYFIANTWLAIGMSRFAYYFSDDTRNFNIIRKIINILAVLDTISILSNLYFSHCFTLELKQIDKDYFMYIIAEKGAAQYFHLLIVYIVVGCVLLELIDRMIHDIQINKNKYRYILCSFLFVIIANLIYQVTDSYIDFSPVFYSFVALYGCYYALYYIPKDIVSHLLMTSVSDMDVGIICFDYQGHCIYQNDAFISLAEAITGDRSLQELDYYWRTTKVQNPLRSKVWNESYLISEGNSAYMHITYKPLLDKNQTLIGYFYSVEDNTGMLKKLEQELYNARHDLLTGLLNRTAFFDAVKNTLEQNPEENYYLITSDIKEFKLLNTLYGVEFADSILKTIAHYMKTRSSADSLLGRIGGDRFAILCNEQNYNESIFISVIQKICEQKQSHFYKMHIHLGVYKITNRNMDISLMCDKAQMAIMSIKDDYHTILNYYDDEIENRVKNENRILSEFNAAIKRKQFVAFYQPQISKEDGMIGAEALVRWIHPKQGIISPGIFIPLLEKAGYIHLLDCYIWEMACQQLKKWKDMGKSHLYISVNISPKDFYYLDIYTTITSLVEKYEIEPSNLRLEITETALMTEIKNQLSVLKRLREYGFRIEIDDFGSGYSSLNTLKDMEVDVLKLDMGFLRETNKIDRSRIIMNRIIQMSEDLGMDVISEGVETKEQVEYLTESGCSLFQGYYFAKPMDVESFEKAYFD